MKHWQNKLLLFLFGFFTLFFVPADLDFILSLLLLIILLSTIYCINNRSYTVFSLLVYCGAAIFNRDLLLFIPLILYDLFLFQLYWMLIPVSAVFLFSIYDFTPLVLVFLVLGSLTSWVLQYLASSNEQIQKLYRKTRDDSMEVNLLLENKNRHLLEKQDYEIYTATLKERNRIAREIHDNVGHMLSRAILMVGALKVVWKDTDTQNGLTQLELTLTTAMDSIRTSVHDLHDESINLKEVLVSLVDSFTFCSIQYSFDDLPEMPKEIKYSLIAIVKEGLSNIIKHSNATEVHLTIKEFPGFYQMILLDNGRNFAASNSGLGLHNIRERVEHLNGTVQFSKNNGFRIFLTIPK